MNFKKSRGMSLAEIVCALGILGVVLVTMIGTLTTGLEAIQKSTNINQANIIAQRTIEQYKGMDYNTITDSSTKINDFAVTVTVSPATYSIPSDPNNGEPYKKVTVVVTNEDSTSIKKRAYVEMETIFIETL